MDITDIKLEAFKQIRIKVSDINDESNNDELAGFVKVESQLDGLYFVLREKYVYKHK